MMTGSARYYQGLQVSPGPCRLEEAWNKEDIDTVDGKGEGHGSCQERIQVCSVDDSSASPEEQDLDEKDGDKSGDDVVSGTDLFYV